METTDYYATSDKQLLDDNGSTVTDKAIYNAGQARLKKKTYEMRYRTEKTNLERVQRICEDLLNDPEKIDTSLKLEKTPQGEAKNSYDLVAIYSVLVPVK